MGYDIEGNLVIVRSSDRFRWPQWIKLKIDIRENVNIEINSILDLISQNSKIQVNLILD